MKNKMQFYSRRQRLFRLQLPHFFANRKVKDRLFCYLFENDRKALLQLYNALNHSNYQDENALQIVTLENVVYMSMKNDLAFLLIGTLNLYEHQSTICPNMPLRFLLYLAAEYEVLAAREKATLYGKKLIQLPAPQCVVFYNGNEEIPDEQYLYLSDAFQDEKGHKRDSSLELKVRVLNINHGHNAALTKVCGLLGEYAHFIAKIKEFQRNGLSTDLAVDSAMEYCIEHGILEDTLTMFRAEVKKMLLTEYNEKKHLRLLRAEAREEGREEGRIEGREEGRIEGREEGRAEGHTEGVKEGEQKERSSLIRKMLQNGCSVEQAAKLTGLSPQEIQDALQKHP